MKVCRLCKETEAFSLESIPRLCKREKVFSLECALPMHKRDQCAPLMHKRECFLSYASGGTHSYCSFKILLLRTKTERKIVARQARKKDKKMYCVAITEGGSIRNIIILSVRIYVNTLAGQAYAMCHARQY